MIYCPECGTANREGSRFCNQCGAQLAEEALISCPRCRATNPATAAHCQECGYDLARTAGGATAEPDAGQGPGQALLLPGEGETGGPVDEGLPPWLDSVERPDKEVTPRRPPAETADEAEGEDLEPRIPRGDWAADAIPIEPIVGVPYRAHERSGLPPTSEQETAAQLFATAAAEEVHAAPPEVAAPPRPRQLEAGLHWLTVLALLAALLVPLIWPSGPLAMVGAVPLPAVAAAKAIGELPPGAPVLLVFDYDAAMAGELQPIAGAFLRQLLSQRVRVLTVSTQPEGAALAQLALDKELPAFAGAHYGQTAANLGYVAGGEVAVRALAANLRAVVPADYRDGVPLARLPALEGVSGAGQMRLIVVLGRDLVAVQRWIEQVAAPYGTALVAGVPALAEPAVQPYWSAGQLRGVVAGLAGAAAYEQLQGTPGQAGQMLGALRTGMLVVAVLVITLNLGTFVGSLFRRRE